MPLDGLRAWIGELERKLGARTKIGLVLVALAVGGAGAGIYLALDAASNSVSKDDLKSLQEQVDQSTGGSGSEVAARVSEAETSAQNAGTEIEELRTQVQALQTQVKKLESGGSTAQTGQGSGPGSGGGGGGGSAPAAK
jgi:uncharacterized protein HemX